MKTANVDHTTQRYGFGLGLGLGEPNPNLTLTLTLTLGGDFASLEISVGGRSSGDH